MKYVVILGDGMADYPIDKLNNRTPLQVAYKPNIDFLSANGEMGLVKTVPDSLKPGSDTANLSAMGFNPEECYTGRSPLEAISMGIKLKDTDIAVRCNLVTLSNDKNYNDKTMVDYSGGEIDTESARILIDYIDKKFKSEKYNFYGGFAYRHCLVVHNTVTGSKLTPPHDITDKKIGSYLPEGLNGQMFYDLMAKSYDLLMEHPINKQRISEGKKPANSIWLWGEGVKPKLKDFYKT
jgi:2,3-bisphosphoglycerate-independent phosphoglycerate mutase